MINVANSARELIDKVLVYADGRRTILSWNELVNLECTPTAFVIDYVHQRFQYPIHQPAILRFGDLHLAPQPRGILSAWMAFVGQALGTRRISRFLGRELELASSALHNAKCAIVNAFDLTALGLTLEPADGSMSGDNTPYILRSAGRQCVVIVPNRDLQIEPIARSVR